MTSNTQSLIVAAIDAAEEVQDDVDVVQSEKPRLLIENCDPHRTVAALRQAAAARPPRPRCQRHLRPRS